MGTPRSSSSKLLLELVVLHLGAAVSVAAGLARTPPAEVLTRTCDQPTWLSVSETQAAVSSLRHELVGCGEPLLKAQIHYRVGVMYFRGGLMEQAVQVFHEVALEKEYPAAVRICSLNMLGQIYRLLGKEGEALEAFSAVINTGEGQGASVPATGTDPTVLQLLCLAHWAKGEIAQARRNGPQSVAEYSRLVDLLNRSGDTRLQQQYGPLAFDRLSQSHLSTGHVADYFTVANKLVESFPSYDRTPVVRLEMLCVKFLAGSSLRPEFHNGALDAPARVIRSLREAKEPPLSHELLDGTERLCQEYGQGYPGILLHYHYAWMLDAVGKKKAAAEALDQIGAMPVPEDAASSSRPSLTRIIRDYATIQRAILLSEQGEHRKALAVLRGMDPRPSLSPVADLRDSTGKAIETLIREMPKNGTN